MTKNLPRQFRTLALLDGRDPRVESIWRMLEAAARPSYFLTWGWIAAWLAALPADALPQLVVIREGGVAVAACFLGRRRLLRHGVLPVRGMFLNTTGVPRLDELCVEHNRMLCMPGTALSLAELVALLPADWDELALPAIDGGTFDPLAAGDGYRVLVDREVSAPFVNLARVRAGDYLSLLGSNTRAQIRRARREVGDCQLEVARSVAHALEIYGELVALHTASWRSRGEAGAFADPWFDRFHRGLIERRFAHGETELLRLRAGGQTLGCTYNLIANDQVLFYQSGLAPFDDPRIKPGYLCHAAAVDHAAARGHATYDMLGGDARYKASLSTDATRLVWLRVQRRLARFAIEDHWGGWKRAYVAWRATRPSSTP
jgi:CelD/BcsL family acetyltransferase involved in cellulose biosynthesis